MAQYNRGLHAQESLRIMSTMTLSLIIQEALPPSFLFFSNGLGSYPPPPLASTHRIFSSALHQRITLSMCRFYLSQAGPTHQKHGGGKLPPSSNRKHGATLLPPLHPSLAFITHYIVATTVIFLIHDAFFYQQSHSNDADEDIIITKRQDKVASFVFVYVIILFGARYVSSFAAGRLRQHAVLYELTWMCNYTLVMGFVCFGGLGNILSRFVNTNYYSRGDEIHTTYSILEWICKRRPTVATACCVGVSIDQILWYVDLAGRAITSEFPIGVTKYLTWKQTLWIDRLTCTHHLWTIPLYICGANGLDFNSYYLSVVIVTIQVLLSRWLTPHRIQLIECDADTKEGLNGTPEDPTRYRYLNVNLSHELWRDISFSFLQISKDDPPVLVYLFRLLWRWQVLNFLVFVGVLLPGSTLYFHHLQR